MYAVHEQRPMGPYSGRVPRYPDMYAPSPAQVQHLSPHFQGRQHKKRMSEQQAQLIPEPLRPRSSSMQYGPQKPGAGNWRRQDPGRAQEYNTQTYRRPDLNKNLPPPPPPKPEPAYSPITTSIPTPQTTLSRDSYPSPPADTMKALVPPLPVRNAALEPLRTEFPTETRARAASASLSPPALPIFSVSRSEKLSKLSGQRTYTFTPQTSSLLPVYTLSQADGHTFAVLRASSPAPFAEIKMGYTGHHAKITVNGHTSNPQKLELERRIEGSTAHYAVDITALGQTCDWVQEEGGAYNFALRDGCMGTVVARADGGETGSIEILIDANDEAIGEILVSAMAVCELQRDAEEESTSTGATGNGNLVTKGVGRGMSRMRMSVGTVRGAARDMVGSVDIGRPNKHLSAF